MKQNEIKEIIEIFNNSDISKLKIKEDNFSIEMEKGGLIAPVAVAAPAAAVQSIPQASIQPAAPAETSKGQGPTLNSPMVGTFYKAPSPNASPFAKVGDTVKKGQTVAIVEAMKIMNEIEAEFDCKIIEFLVEDGQPVEFDMPLFAVEKL